MSEAAKRVANERWEDRTSARRYAERSDALAGEKKQAWLDVIREQVGEERKRVLDVGTGAGLLALLYAELGHEVTGLDFSEVMLEEARQRSERTGLPAEFVRGDGEALPFEDGSFDVVTNRIVIWSLPEPGVAVREWVRGLAPGGRLVLFGNHPDSPSPLPRALIRRARGLQSLLSGRPRAQSFARASQKEWERTVRELPFHHAPPQKIKALFDAAGLAETEITSIGDHIGDRRSSLLWERTVPWHTVTGRKPR